MKYRLEVGLDITLTIYARATFSVDILDVKTNEQYMVSWDDEERWVDLMIPCSPKGYHNHLADLLGQRVKGMPCFCLCAAYNKNDATGFAIVKDELLTPCIQDGELSFFPNDVAGFEWNNWGKIKINIKRVV